MLALHKGLSKPPKHILGNLPAPFRLMRRHFWLDCPKLLPTTPPMSIQRAHWAGATRCYVS